MKKIISFILSLLLLLSSTGITYAAHYCGDFKMMEEISIGQQHLSCGMVMEDTSCDDGQQEDHDCCDNQYTSITTDDNFAKASFDLQLPSTFVPAFIAVFVLDEVVLFQEKTPEYSEYNPPPLIKDIPVLYETFLI